MIKNLLTLLCLGSALSLVCAQEQEIDSTSRTVSVSYLQTHFNPFEYARRPAPAVAQEIDRDPNATPLSNFTLPTNHPLNNPVSSERASTNAWEDIPDPLLQATPSAVKVADVVRSGNAEFAKGAYEEAIVFYLHAHSLLEQYNVGDDEEVDITGQISAEEASGGVFYLEDEGGEKKSGYVSTVIAICFDHLKDAHQAAEWYGVAGWHFEDDPDTQNPACFNHYLAANKYSQGDNPNYHCSLQQVLGGLRTAQRAVLHEEYASEKESFINNYRTQCNFSKLCKVKVEELEKLPDLYPYKPRYIEEFKKYASAFDRLIEPGTPS